MRMVMMDPLVVHLDGCQLMVIEYEDQGNFEDNAKAFLEALDKKYPKVPPRSEMSVFDCKPEDLPKGYTLGDSNESRDTTQAIDRLRDCLANLLDEIRSELELLNDTLDPVDSGGEDGLG